jgi:hypothetical protein
MNKLETLQEIKDKRIRLQKRGQDLTEEEKRLLR